MTDLYHNYAVATATSTVSPAAAAAITMDSTAVGDAEGAVATAAADTSSVMAGEAQSVTASTTATAVLAANAAATLMVPLPPPSSSFSTLDGVPRGKCAYFVRHNVGGQSLTSQNFHEQVLYGDLPIHSKIDSLAILSDEVFQPLLENTSNSACWPEIVANDLQTKIKDVRNTLSEV